MIVCINRVLLLFYFRCLHLCRDCRCLLTYFSAVAALVLFVDVLSVSHKHLHSGFLASLCYVYPLVLESLKVLEFKRCKFKPLKVLENEGGP